MPSNGELITQSSILPEIIEEVLEAYVSSLITLKHYLTTGAWRAVVQRYIEH